MVSSTHDHDQIVVSKGITPASSSNNSYGLSKIEIAESSPAKKYALSKPKDDNVKNKEIVDAIVLDNNNELFHVEEEVNICDTCGDLGWERLLVICGKCKVGAQHTYCMIEKVDKVPDKWSCYGCTEDQDKMRESERNIETSSRKRKAESLFDNFEVAEKNKRPGLLNTQNNCTIFGVDLSMCLSTDLNEDANTDLKKYPGIDLNKDHNCVLKCCNTFVNPYRDVDLNRGPNTNRNIDPNMGIFLNRASSFELGSSSNI